MIESVSSGLEKKRLQNRTVVVVVPLSLGGHSGARMKQKQNVH